jgi:MbtH protein
VTSPFNNPNESLLVLVNAEGQHSLWPSAVAVPTGWNVTHGPASPLSCLDVVRQRWTDLRPRSLVLGPGWPATSD